MRFIKAGVRAFTRGTHYSRVFVSLVLSFFCVMLLPILTAVLLGIQSIDAVSSELRAANAAARKNLVTEMEFAVDAAVRLSYLHANNPLIRSYARSSERQFYLEREICQRLLGSQAGYKALKSSYLYFPQFQLVLSAEGSCDSDTFFRRNYGGSMADWYSVMEPAFVPLEAQFLTSPGSENPDMFTLVRSVSYNNPTNLPAVVVTHLDADFLRKRAAALCRTPMDQYAFYNQTGIILSNARADAVALTAGKGGEEPLLLGNDRYLLSKAASSAYGFELAYAAPEGFENSAVRFVSRYVLISLAFCLLISLILCLLLAWRSYRPVRRICSLVGAEITSSLHNEYGMIETALEDYQKRNSALSETLERGIGEFQEMYLEKLLLGKVRDISSVRESLELYGIDLKKPFTTLILFDLSEDSVLFQDDTLDERQRRELTRLVVQNIASELFSEYCGAIVIQADEQFVCICNTPAGDAQTLQRLWELAQDAARFIQTKFYIVLNPFVSRICHCIDDLPEAYQEAAALAQEAQEDEPGAGPGYGRPGCVERCVCIIKEQYTDNNLSLSFIAEQLKMNASYVSRYFKQQTGVGLLDYLHRYRISAAKRLIKSQPEVLMKDIAAQCGFYNVSALTRVFKKIEGVTPSHFRDMHHHVSDKASL